MIFPIRILSNYTYRKIDEFYNTYYLIFNDLVVINTKDATLVVPKDQVEEVKGLVTFLKENGQGELT